MSVQLDLKTNEVIDWVEFDIEVIHPKKKQKTEDLSSDLIRVIPSGPYVVNSPLIKGRISYHPQKTVPVTHLLFEQQSSTVSQREVPPVVIEQAKKVEALLASLELDIKKIIYIESKIKSIMENDRLNTDQILAELGLLYYFLCRDGTVGYEESFIDKRIEEISQHAEDLRLDHEMHCPSQWIKLLPSGKISYLMRALVRMIFTPDGKFNEGGCYAVKILMSSSLSLIISQERRAQILQIVASLIADHSFRDKFMNPFVVHEDLHDLIRIDLKLPVKEDVVFLYVRWDLLIALFSLIGQIGEGNCYAVASTSNLFGQHPDLLLDFLIEALQKGFFSFEGTEIPFLPLLESRRRYEKDFQAQIPAESTVELTGLYVARASLEIVAECKPLSESRTLESVMEAQFQEKSGYAKEVFLSLKYNLLQQAFLSILQFISINSTAKIKVSEITYFSWKIYLYKGLTHQIFNNFNKGNQSPKFQHFLTKFSSELERRIWLVDYRSWNQRIESGRIVFDYHSQGLKAEGDLSMYNPLMFVRRLCSLNRGKFSPLDRISDLAVFLSSLVDEIPIDDLDLDELNNLQSFKSYLHSTQSTQALAKIVEIHNKTDVPFKWEHYYESDSFFLVQRGGDVGLITLWEPIISRFAPPTIIHSTSIINFFMQLCHKLNAFREQKPSFFNRHDPQILMKIPGHVFNLNPLRFESFWSSGVPFEVFKQSINVPGETLRRKRPSFEMKMRILRMTVGEEFSAQIYRRISQKNVGVERFRLEVLSVLNKQYHERFDNALNSVLTEVPPWFFIRVFPSIEKALGYRLPLNQEKDILKFIVQNTEGKKQLSTAQLSHLYHESLIKVANLYIPFHVIESAICFYLHLPQTIDLGNLNWTPELQEEMVYYRLILKYDIAKDWYVFCKRQDGIDSPLYKSFLDNLIANTQLYFET